MCKSRRDGGQRCHAHALKAFKREQQACVKAAGASAHVRASAAVRLEQAETDLASTPEGRDFLLRDVHGFSRTGQMMDAAMRGLARADKAEQWAALSKAAKNARMSRDRTLKARQQQVREALTNYRMTGTAVTVGAATTGAMSVVGTSTPVAGGVATWFALSVVNHAVQDRKNARHAASRVEEDIHWMVGARVDHGDPALVRRATAEVEASIDRVYATRPELGEDIKRRVRAEAQRRLDISGQDYCFVTAPEPA